MGGLPAGAVEPAEHDYALWEKRVDALMALLGHKDRRLITVDELRRNIESLGPEAYDTMSYYERWIKGAEVLLPFLSLLVFFTVNVAVWSSTTSTPFDLMSAEN